MIAVVDYRKGNLLSVQRGLVAVGAQARITSDPAEIAAADAIVLPGVGAFAAAAETMRELGQMDVVHDRVMDGVPFLGICLGMHLMFEQGVEGSPAERATDFAETASAVVSEDDAAMCAPATGTTGSFARDAEYAQGLGLIPGLVAALPREDAQGRSYKIPHVGWNEVSFTEQGAGCPLFEGIPEGEYFYFTHSYASPESDATIATTTHSVTFPCAVQVGQHAFGVQFHPEKSSDAGLALLKNFVTLAKEA